MADTKFSHQKADSPEARYAEEGLRAFFAYRAMGIIEATHGKLRVQLVRAARKASEAKGGTGFHIHTADVHVVYMVRGWARFDYDGVDTLVEAGDCVHQRPGIVHNLYDWSDDMEFMEIIAPADFTTTEITSPAVVAAR
jgi:quercetin dioxygenase-like cupin family protein